VSMVEALIGRGANCNGIHHFLKLHACALSSYSPARESTTTSHT
jgi:hypothetical protein